MNDIRKMLNANRFSFFAAGFGIAAWAPMIPFIKERFALDEHQLGLLLLCIALGSLISMPLSGFLSSKFGCRLPITLSGSLLGVVLTGIAVSESLILTAVLLVVFGILAVILDVVSNINAAIVEKQAQRSVMSGLHGLYSVGGFVGALGVTFLLSINFGLLITSLLVTLSMILCSVFGCRNLITELHEEKKEDSEDKVKMSTFQACMHPSVLLIGVMCFIMFQTEGSVLDWSGVFLRQERGVPLEYAGYGYAAFAIAMTAFRLTGDRLVDRFGRRVILTAGPIFIAMGFNLAVAVPHWSTALLGFVLIGVGASNVVPQLISVVAGIKEVPSHISVTAVNTIGFTGILCGPALIGFLAHAISLPYTYLCQAAAVLPVGIMCFIMLKSKKKQDLNVMTCDEQA